MNTKTETSDLKWTTFSLARPEVRNPSLRRVVCITDTDRAATAGDFLSASSCSFVTLDIKELLIWRLTDRIRAERRGRGIGGEWEADALISSVKLGSRSHRLVHGQTDRQTRS